MDDRLLLREDEVARLLGLEVGTLRKWRARRTIPFVRIGRTVRYRREDIERIVADNVVEAV